MAGEALRGRGIGGIVERVGQVASVATAARRGW